MLEYRREAGFRRRQAKKDKQFSGIYNKASREVLSRANEIQAEISQALPIFLKAAGTEKTPEEVRAILSEIDRDLDHLQFGITGEEAAAFMARIGFPETYKRDEQKLGWVTAQCGTSLTGYDVCAAIRLWLETNEYSKYSVVQILMAEGSSGVGLANVFLSHVQSESLANTLKALLGCEGTTQCVDGKDILFWIDYFVLKQCQRDFDPKKIAIVIDNIGSTWVNLDFGLSYFKRSFCLFETAASMQGWTAPNTTVIGFSPEFKPIPLGGRVDSLCTSYQITADPATLQRLNDLPDDQFDALVDSEKAETRDPEDKKFIDQWILANCAFEGKYNTVSGDSIFAHIDSEITREFRSRCD